MGCCPGRSIPAARRGRWRRRPHQGTLRRLNVSRRPFHAGGGYISPPFPRRGRLISPPSRRSANFSASSHPARSLRSYSSAMLDPATEPEMSILHSLLENLTAAGSLYGWRIDAMVLGGLLWALATSYGQVRATIA